MCVCTHTPSSGLVGLISQPAVVHVLPSLSVHGVLVFGVHFPLVVSQTPLHSSAAGQTLALWFWSHTPEPLHPAVVHGLPSVSAHGELFAAISGSGSHTPAPSHPDVVHALPSVSEHGKLSATLLVSHSPVRTPSVLVGLQMLVMHSVLGGQGVTPVAFGVEAVSGGWVVSTTLSCRMPGP